MLYKPKYSWTHCDRSSLPRVLLIMNTLWSIKLDSDVFDQWLKKKKKKKKKMCIVIDMLILFWLVMRFSSEYSFRHENNSECLLKAIRWSCSDLLRWHLSITNFLGIHTKCFPCIIDFLGIHTKHMSLDGVCRRVSFEESIDVHQQGRQSTRVVCKIVQKHYIEYPTKVGNSNWIPSHAALLMFLLLKRVVHAIIRCGYFDIILGTLTGKIVP